MSINIWLIFIAQLGSDNFQTRDRATCVLNKNAETVEIQLLLSEKDKDREIARRSNQILNKYYSQNAEKWAENSCEKWPWVYGDGLASYYLEQARKIEGICGPNKDWKDYRLASKLWVIDMYRERKTRKEVNIVLEEFKNQEIYWTKSFGQRYYPQHYKQEK